MKRNAIPAAFLTAALLLAALAGCGGKNTPGGESSLPSSGVAGVSSVAASSAPPQSNAASSTASSAVSSNAGQPPAESQNGPVVSVQTDDKAFNQKFAANPIDPAYIKESANAISNVDMMNTSGKYAALWEKEVSHAWSELSKYMASDSSEKPKQYKAEQEKWQSGKDAALKKISDDALAEGGSMASLNKASKIMDFYRNRAAQLYKELYGYNKDYTYAYKA